MENEKALGAFIEKIGKINARIEALKNLAENHMNYEPETVNWGHVGSAAHVLEQLSEITDFLGLEIA
jgi:hypothetical protein